MLNICLIANDIVYDIPSYPNKHCYFQFHQIIIPALHLNCYFFSIFSFKNVTWVQMGKTNAKKEINIYI